MTDFVVVIPARYGSTRLPGKPLLELGGKPMVQHVAERALLSDAREVIVATDDERVVAAIRGLPIRGMLTAATHTSGSDRVHEVAHEMDWDEDVIVVNVQGDEPLIPAEVINQVASLADANPSCAASTLSEPLVDAKDIRDPNVVKVVSTADGIALYFSRAPIPWDREKFPLERESGVDTGWMRHVGIYAYRVWALDTFVTLNRSRLEQTESLEQLRFLENGYSIAIAEACSEIPPGVDTPDDLERVRTILAE